MSYLNNNNEFLSTKITNVGRNSIANGDFNIKYFQIGDSEYDYSLQDENINQRVLSPTDMELQIKYPYKLDDNENTTTYGTVIKNSETITIRNVMGTAGFVNKHIEYSNINGTTIFTPILRIDITTLNGTNQILITDGSIFSSVDFITIIFDDLVSINDDTAIITGLTNSLVYKILSVSGNTLTLDRPTPDYTELTGFCNIIINEFINDNADNEEQQSSWVLNNVWSEKPIGSDVGGINEELKTYQGSELISTKEFLGYNNDNLILYNISGQTVDSKLTFVNSFNEKIETKNKSISVIHYSKNGDMNIDPNRFFKYDDYISSNIDDSIGVSLVNDNVGNPLSDNEYFEVYIPFILYHRNNDTTIGAYFKMETEIFYLKSKFNSNFNLYFKYLVDEQNNRVGKVFLNNRIIVFDDEEIVAALDYRSNRRFTLDSLKLSYNPILTTNQLPLLNEVEETLWVTYLVGDSNNFSPSNSLPCNYYNKIDSNGLNTEVSFAFSPSSFRYYTEYPNEIKNRFSFKEFNILVQKTPKGEQPIPSAWRIINYNNFLSKNIDDNIIIDSLFNRTFIITKQQYDNATFFDLETYMGNNYLSTPNSNSLSQFGDEQPFNGSVRLVRSSDIEEMNFLINLPNNQFNVSQNTTYTNDKNLKITEVVLLNDNRKVMVSGKFAKPIDRLGSQIISVKLDF